jgi:hypothetical protein
MNRRTIIAVLLTLIAAPLRVVAQSPVPDDKLSPEELHKKYTKRARLHAEAANYWDGRTKRKTARQAKYLKRMADLQRRMAREATRLAEAGRAGRKKRFTLTKKAYRILANKEQELLKKVQ